MVEDVRVKGKLLFGLLNVTDKFGGGFGAFDGWSLEE